MRISVVISAYANADALDLTLQGYALQRVLPDEVIVAEDSQAPDIAAVVARHQATSPWPLVHLTQEDLGFRKCVILNSAIARTQADFVVFTDADCVPRADVVATFRRLARPGRFVSAGSHVNLPPSLHRRPDLGAHLLDQSVFDARWLQTQGVATPALRLLTSQHWADCLDRLSPRQAFVGNLSGAWRNDLLRVGGFDETMGYGGEDINLGVRLKNAGVRGYRARHALVCLHLDHARPWRVHEEALRNNAWNRTIAGTATVLPRRSSLT